MSGMGGDRVFYYLHKAWRRSGQRRWLWVAGAAAALVLVMPQPDGLSIEGQRMLALLAFFIIAFVTEALPIGASFPLVLAWIVLLEIRPPGEAVKSIAHDAALFMMGALMIARVLVRRNLHQRALALVLRIIPPRTGWLVFTLVAFGALSSALISDHTVAALLLPVGTALVVAAGGIRENPRFAKLLMLSIAFACAIGGLATPSGGSRNVVMMAYLQDIAGQPVSFRLWLSMAAPVMLVLIPVTVGILYLMYRPEKKDLGRVGENLLREMKLAGPMQMQDWATLTIFSLILLAWVTVGERYGIGLIAVTGALLYLIVGLADWEGDYQHINWGLVWLYFAAVSFGRALEASGAALFLAERVVGGVQGWLGMESGIRLAASSAVFMTLFSQTMSNGPAVALLGPVVLESARISGTSAILVGMATAIASSFAFMMIIGTPSNAIVYASGYLEARDFIRAGLWMTVASLLVLMAAAAYWWPRLGIV